MRIPKRTDNKLDFNQFSKLIGDVNRIDNLQFDPTIFNVIEDQTGIYVSMITSEIETTPTDFEIKKIDKYDVTIYGGTITIGSTDYEIADTTLTISEDCTVGIEFTFATKTAYIVNWGSTFYQDDDHIRIKRYKIKYDTGGAVITRNCKHMVFPANWGNY